MVGSSFWLQYRASCCGIGVSVVVGTISGVGAGAPRAYIHAYIGTCRHAYIHTYHAYRLACATCKRAYMHADIYRHTGDTHAHTFVCNYVLMYVCMCVYIYVCICVYP